MSKHSKEKEITIHEVTTYEEQIAKLKEAAFSILNAHLQQNCEAPAYPYYIFLLLEHLALLWYIVNPGLNIYQGAYLTSEINSRITFSTQSSESSTLTSFCQAIPLSIPRW